jgi:VIT1/CCC1 family predicted Fe2+/Mn2+ transporter
MTRRREIAEALIYGIGVPIAAAGEITGGTLAYTHRLWIVLGIMAALLAATVYVAVRILHRAPRREPEPEPPPPRQLTETESRAAWMFVWVTCALGALVVVIAAAAASHRWAFLVAAAVLTPAAAVTWWQAMRRVPKD